MHEASRGFAFPTQQPLVRGIRLVERGVTPKPPVLARLGTLTDAEEARTGSRPAHFGGRLHRSLHLDGTQLGPGARITGPALIQEPFTVIVLAPDDSAHLDEHGNYDITIAAEAGNRTPGRRASSRRTPRCPCSGASPCLGPRPGVRDHRVASDPDGCAPALLPRDAM